MPLYIEIYKYKYYIYKIVFMFRSYEFSLSVSCSELLYPAQSLETVLPNVTS